MIITPSTGTKVFTKRDALYHIMYHSVRPLQWKLGYLDEIFADKPKGHRCCRFLVGRARCEYKATQAGRKKEQGQLTNA